jgi:hypothetical protein
MQKEMENIFGEPGKGFHATRIGGLALYDILGTIGLALATTYFFNISLLWSLVIWFVLGEILHWYFGVKTAFMRLLTNTTL